MSDRRIPRPSLSELASADGVKRRLPDWLTAERIGGLVPDWLPLNGPAAARASTVTVVIVVLFVALQGSVGALFVGGSQPMAVAGEVPIEPTAAQWEQAPSRTVELNEQRMAVPWGGGSVDEMEVQALTNESHVAFRLSWDDPTTDTSRTAPERYSDAAAVMLKGGGQPPITMGAVGEPVNIWYWRASWQFNQTRAEWTNDMYAYPHNDSLTMPGRQAGNPLSQASYKTYGQNYYAKGFGSLSDAPHQNIWASATRTDERWTVTFVRERSTDGTYDAGFGEHDNMYLAFAVWNGSAGEVNGEKSLTLQYSTLDTKSGEFSAAGSAGSDSGGSDGAGSAGGEGSGADGGDGGGDEGASGSPLTGWLMVLVAVAVFTWIAAYWRMRP